MEHNIMMIMNFILCCLDVLMLCVFFSSMFEKRTRGLGFLCGFLAMAIAMFAVNSFGSSMINFLFVPFIVFAFSLILFRLSIRKGIIYTLIFYIVFTCGREMAFEMLYRLLISVFPGFNIDFTSLQGMGILLIEYILSFLFLLFVRRYTVKIEISDDSRFDWYLLIMPVASIMILFSFVYMDFPGDRAIQVLMCGGAFLLYFSNAAIFVILAHFTQMMNENKISAMSLLKRDMEKNNFQHIEKTNEVYRKYMHDVHQYFYQFRNLALKGEDKSIVNIIDEWESGLKKEEKSTLYTESPVLNSVMEEYINRAAMQKIDMEIFVEEGISVDFIRDTDKISLFGNLLENAVEAAGRCEEDNRRIQVKLFMGNSYILVFQIKNTWDRNLRREEDFFHSTKKDADKHGLGIGIVREIAGRYGGGLELEEQGEWFVTTLMISNCIKQ